jgi:uncharacterized damage-inducible protein DinB
LEWSEFFAAQLEREAPLSRKALERVPEGKPDWKPHEKSMPLGYLSQLVATMPGWITMAAHDESVAGALDALGQATDRHLATSWKLLVGGRVAMEQPRYVVIADTFTHLAHHRGQLTVYLRLNGVPVPSIYGPTADERPPGF